MSKWGVVIFDSAASFHVVYSCEDEMVAKEYVINTMNHYKTTEYLNLDDDDETDYRIDDYTNGAMQLRIIEPNGEVTSVCAMRIRDECLEQKKVISCYKSYGWPKVFEIGNEEERVRNTRSIWLRHIAEERRNKVKLDEEKTICLIDDTDLESDDPYIYIHFTNGDEVFGGAADVKPIGNRCWYDCTEDI